MLLVHEFCQQAGFPSNWRESDLQEYVAQRLQDLGYSAKLEVKMNGGRADILTNWKGGTIIECKKYLSRSDIYQAKGQLDVYALKNNYQLCIIGFAPTSESEISSAMTTASLVKQDARVSVVFLNFAPEWLPGQVKQGNFLLNFLVKLIPRFTNKREPIFQSKIRQTTQNKKALFVGFLIVGLLFCYLGDRLEKSLISQDFDLKEIIQKIK